MKILIVFILTTLVYSGSFAQKKNAEDPINIKNSNKVQTAEQTTHNFLIENNKLIWQKVFDTKLDFESLLSKIISDGIIENIEVSDKKITGDLKQIPPDYKGAGYSLLNMQGYIYGNLLTGFVLLEFKEGAYRITLKNILSEKQYAIGNIQQGTKTPIESYAIKGGKNEFKNPFLNSSSDIYNYTFTKTFNFNSPVSIDSW